MAGEIKHEEYEIVIDHEGNEIVTFSEENREESKKLEEKYLYKLEVYKDRKVGYDKYFNNIEKAIELAEHISVHGVLSEITKEQPDGEKIIEYILPGRISAIYIRILGDTEEKVKNIKNKK